MRVRTGHTVGKTMSGFVFGFVLEDAAITLWFGILWVEVSWST